MLDLKNLKSTYGNHKQSAKARGIDFLLSFDEWLGIWIKSKKLGQRGRLKGQYVMARFNDSGPYAVGNVRIITNTENTKEFFGNETLAASRNLSLSKAFLGKVMKDSTKQKLRSINLGKKLSSSTKEKLSKSHLGKKVHTEESKKKLSDISKKMWSDPVKKSEMIAGRIGKKRSDETKNKMRISARLREYKKREQRRGLSVN